MLLLSYSATSSEAAKREAPEFPGPRQTSINQEWKAENLILTDLGDPKYKVILLDIRNFDLKRPWRSEI